MNPIKEFFKKKKVEREFKHAGKGHKLCESASSKPPARGSTQPVASGSRHSPVRPLPSEGAKRAGAAALARVEQKQQPAVNWSLAATKAQARKELELENAVKMKHTPKEVVQDSCPALSVSGVYFSCPIIGPDILPRNEIQAKIKQFLYDQLDQEKGLTACLIIHTCNKNKEKVRIGIELLIKYLNNIIENPTEVKFHKIRLKNKVFQEKVSELEGALDFLAAAGFCQQVIKQGEEEEDYLVFPEDELEDLENLQMLKEALLSAEPIVPILDRNMKVLLPSQVTEQIRLPNDFFNLSAEEIRREQEAKTEEVELGKVLRTKAMRERDEIKELHMYKYSLIRIRFPDEIILQGTFHVFEKLSAVKEFITENLALPEIQYNLLVAGGFKLTEDDQSLLDLKLVPAAILNFHWQNDNPEEKACYLKPETMLLLENL